MFPAEAVSRVTADVLIWSDVCEETRAEPCRDNQESRPALFEDELNDLLWPDHYLPAGQTERPRPDLCDGAQEAITIMCFMREQRRVTSRDQRETHTMSSLKKTSSVCDTAGVRWTELKVQE